MSVVTLNLETFERFMLSHDRDTASNTFSFELHLDGVLQRERLQDAIEATSGQHPMVMARLDESGDQWLIGSSPPELGEDLETLEPDPFDLRRESGIRIGIKNRPDGRQTLLFVTHHACLDALGTLQFIQDLSKNYSRDAPPASSDDLRPAIKFLKHRRASYGSSPWLSRLRWPIDLLGMVFSLELFVNRPVSLPIEPPNTEFDKIANATESVLRRAVRTVFLDEAKFASARSFAKSRGLTFNDHLLASCFLSLERWFETHDPENTRSLYRVMVPVNLRRGEIKSASNMVAMVHLDRRPGRAKSMRRFRKLISMEMGAIKRFRIGVTGNRMLWLVHKLFGDWSIFDDENRCMTTCVLSNIGDLSKRAGYQDSGGRIRFGGVVTTSIDFSGFVGKNTHVCFHAYSYVERLQIVATYNPNCLTPQDVDFLLETMVSQLVTDDPP